MMLWRSAVPLAEPSNVQSPNYIGPPHVWWSYGNVCNHSRRVLCAFFVRYHCATICPGASQWEVPSAIVMRWSYCMLEVDIAIDQLAGTSMFVLRRRGAHHARRTAGWPSWIAGLPASHNSVFCRVVELVPCPRLVGYIAWSLGSSPPGSRQYRRHSCAMLACAMGMPLLFASWAPIVGVSCAGRTRLWPAAYRADTSCTRLLQ